MGRAITIADLPEDGQRFCTVDHSLAIIAEPELVPAGIVEGTGPAGPVASAPVELQSLRSVTERFAEALGSLVRRTEVDMGTSLPKAIAEPAEQAERFGQVTACLVMQPE